MRVIAIVNPIAGAKRDGRQLGRFVRGARAAGITVEVQTTRAAGHAIELAGHVPDRTGAIVIVGGDGTIREVVDGLGGRPIPLVLWPMGTENLVAKSFGFRADPGRTLACLQAGRCLDVDMGVVNGRSFLVVVGVGFDAEVVHRLMGRRIGHITHLSYGGSMWRTYWEHRFPAVRVHTDEGAEWRGRGLVFIGNMPRYALGLPVVRDALPSDGLLDVCVFPCRSRTALIGHSLRTLLRRHVERGGVWYRRATTVRVESDGTVPVELDGEVGGFLPIDVSIRPRAVRLLVPAEYRQG